jgi:two-component system cell cycle sensor histidine kinase/response regulator CckA
MANRRLQHELIGAEGRAASRILLAEDDPVINKHLTQALKKSGFEVDSARDGGEALELFQCNDYQLLITDIIMPRMDGIGLTQQVRKFRPQLPVILMSGFSEEEVSALENIGPENTIFLQKPFAISKLMATIAELLNPPGQTRTE